MRTLVVAALLGIPIALASMLTMGVIHALERLVWHDVPRAVQAWNGEPAGWYVVAVTTCAAAIAAMLLGRIPEQRSHTMALEPVSLRHLPWVLAGAVMTLAGGLVLGPEAPLLVLGVALTGVAVRRLMAPHVASERDLHQLGTLLAIAGAVIVLTTVLASPLVAIVLMLEIVASSGRIPSDRIVAALVPALLAGGVGALVFAGVGAWSGIAPPTIALPDLPPYATVHIIDLAWAPIVAIIASIAVLATQRLSARLGPVVTKRPVLVTALFGLLTGVLAICYRVATNRPVDDVLFSGQQALPDIVGIDVAWILLLLVLAKGIAYAVALAGRLEGGQIFPALAISAGLGVVASIVLPGAELTAMLAVAIAAGTSSIQRLPIFGTVFAVLIVGGGSEPLDVLTLAIIGAVVGWVVAGARGSGATAEPATS